MSDINQRITTDLKNERVVLYMKGTPDLPACGFSAFVARVLQRLQVPFTGHDVLQDSDLRQGIKAFSDWPTIPQLYIDREFIGGCDIVREMVEKGEFQTLLRERGLMPTRDEA